MSDPTVEARKDHHIDIVLEQAVHAPTPALGFGRYTLTYDALPEIALSQVDLSTTLFGRRLRAPILVGAMTGGTERTAQINRTLARGAARCGLGMALGSQRAMWVNPAITSSFQVRDAAPDLPLLFANAGAVQLNYGMGAHDLQSLVDAVGADVLNLHLNPLQEAIQPEGDTDFRGLLSKLQAVLPQLSVPVVVKEVGAGLGERTLSKLRTLPIAGVEVAGTGGTSWAAVESHRAGPNTAKAQAGRHLAGFGVPTPQSLKLARAAFPDRLVIASGGLRHAMDIATSLAMGADAVALARPLLQAAMQGEDALVDTLEALIETLRIIAFCTGSADLQALARVDVLDTTRA